MSNLIPARYVGGHAVLLAEHQGPHYDANGVELTSNLVRPGDTLMMPETEVLGETMFEDTPDTGRLRSLGPGRVYLDDKHAQLDPDELSALGYRFFLGRPDFEAIVPEPPAREQPKSSKSKKSADEPAPAPESR